jgi:mycofactocin glycosyltransferase
MVTELALGLVTGAGLTQRWQDALLLDGETDLIESSVRELTEYFGISRVDALEACVTALRESKREWEADPRETPADIEAFYRTTRSYLFEHLWWHATDPDECAGNVALLDYACSIGAYQYLDFGSGVGSTAILFARHGLKVTLADISPTMLAFARWRLQRRGLHAEFIDLNHQVLPRQRFAFATAVDVLEHLCDPAGEMEKISQALVAGGVFAFNFRAGHDPERPMHILPTGAPIFQALRGCGLRALTLRGGIGEELQQREFYCAKRVSHSRVRNWGYQALDLVSQSDRMQQWMRWAS